MDYPDESGVPADVGSPEELRRVAAHLINMCPKEDAFVLVRRKEYELIHELAGYHDAIKAIQELADELDAADRTAQAAQVHAL